MPPSRSARLLHNAEAALISAIEIYNKPTFAFREETFAILALNAWELLLKAKLLEIHGNKLKCLHIYSTRELAPGRTSGQQNDGEPRRVRPASVPPSKKIQLHPQNVEIKLTFSCK